jgi:enoyl-[acyl-carrier-protein] reductase (NADH)
MSEVINLPGSLPAALSGRLMSMPGNGRISEERVRQTHADEVPMKCGRTHTDVCNGAAFPASDQASCMTGQAINVTDGQEMH